MFSQAAYVIHKREYKEKSALVSFLGAESGRFQAIVHSTKKPAKAALLQPFQQLEVVTTQAPKANSLVTIRQIEGSSVRFPLIGNSSICGLYINELVYRLLNDVMEHEMIFMHYEHCMYRLLKSIEQTSSSRLQSWALRKFEYELLQISGQGISFEQDSNGVLLDEDKLYYCIPEVGLLEANSHQTLNLSGHCYRSLLQEECPPTCLGGLKRVMQMLLQKQLGAKPLKSIALWQSLNS